MKIKRLSLDDDREKCCFRCYFSERKDTGFGTHLYCIDQDIEMTVIDAKFRTCSRFIEDKRPFKEKPKYNAIRIYGVLRLQNESKDKEEKSEE